MIRFGVTGDYPPFAERQVDGTFTGADIVTAHRVAEALGARAEFVTTTWSTLSADLTTGKFDVAIGGLTETPERAAIGIFSVPLMDDGKRPLARCAERRRYPSLTAIDRSNVRVAVNRGPLITVLAKQWFHQAQVTIHDDGNAIPDELLKHRADVWITDGVVVDRMASRYRGRLCATTHTPFTHVTKAWLIRSDPAFVASINRALAAAIRDGSWRKALETMR